MPDDQTIQSLFNLYSHGTVYRISEISEGLSGALVLLVQITGKGTSDYSGLAFAKIDKTGRSVREVHNLRLVRRYTIKRYVPEIVDEAIGPVADNWMMVLYSVAQDTTINVTSLGQAVTERVFHVQELANQIEHLLQNVLASWHDVPNLCEFAEKQQPARHLSEMLNIGGKDRVSRIADRLSEYMGVNNDRDWLLFHLGTGSQMLPNPLSFLARTSSQKEPSFLMVPTSYCHGDLHSGNIMVKVEEHSHLSDATPWLIDFAQLTPHGSPFFDLAYLEFDLLMRSLDTNSLDDWKDWDFITIHLTSDIHSLEKPNGKTTLYVWELVEPIRHYLATLLQEVGNHVPTYLDQFERCWWLAMTAAGLIYAQHRDVRSQQHRKVALLYAARSLAKVIGTSASHMKKEFYEVKFGYADQVRVIPDAHNEEIDRWLEPYLDWVIAQHETLQLPTTPHMGRSPSVPLEKVYVALRGDKTNTYERMQARDLLHSELEEHLEMFDLLAPDERIRLRGEFLREHPFTTLAERDRGIEGPSLTLAEAFRQFRRLVILGDPGSGKTTLARWIALQFARALKVNVANNLAPAVKVPMNQVNPDTPTDTSLISLGPTRLPILVRVSEYAEWRTSRKYGESTAVIDFLGSQTWLGNFLEIDGIRRETIVASLHKLMRWYIDKQRAIIILDGMDEINVGNNRDEIVAAIETFTGNYIPESHDDVYWMTPEFKAMRPQDIDQPARSGRNQLLITSRIAGYHVSPIRSKDVMHVIIEPMRRPAIEHFCDSWLRAVNGEEYDLNTPEALARLTSEAEGLKQAIFDPKNIGVREIATNPLLVTILALVYRARNGSLPQQRAELYETALELLVEVWRDTEMSTDKAMFVLSPLAAFIHENYPSGLISENELISKLRDRLAVWENISSDRPPEWLQLQVSEFIVELKQKVGLLAARGDYLYGFLHLTFQEYLAARHLVRTESEALKNITDKLGDPRWREPILMALGYVSWKWPQDARERLLQDLLDYSDPLGIWLPRTALLVVEALRELGSISNTLLKEITRRLLRVFADRQLLAHSEALRQRVKDALIRIRRAGHKEAMDEVLVEALTNPSELSQMQAAAHLIHEQKWFTAPIVDALMYSLDYDEAEWGCPIDRSLRELVRPDIDYEVLKPKALKLPQDDMAVTRRELQRIESGELLEAVEMEIATKMDQLVDQQKVISKQLINFRAQASILYVALRMRTKKPVQQSSRQQTLREVAASKLAAIERYFPDFVNMPAEISKSADERSLRQLCDDAESLLQILPSIPEVDSVVAELESRRQRIVTGALRDELVAQLDSAGNVYAEAMRAYGIAEDVLRAHESQEALKEYAPLPTARLHFRLALERDPALLHRVTSDRAWLGLVTMLYGGFHDLDADRIHNQYSEIAQFLNKPDAERNAIIAQHPDFYYLYFGIDDTIYSAAVVLDTVGKKFNAALNVPPEFSTSAIYRESPLTHRLLLSALRSGQEAHALIPSLRNIWKTSRQPEMRRDALVALLSLGEDIIEDLEITFRDAQERTVAEMALRHIKRVRLGLRDAVARSRTLPNQAVDALIAKQVSAGEWSTVFQVFARSVVKSCKMPIRFSTTSTVAAADAESSVYNTSTDSLEEQIVARHRSALLANDWVDELSGYNEDPRSSMTALLNTMPKNEALLHLLLNANEAPNRKWGHDTFRWEVSALAPRYNAQFDDDIPLEALRVLSGIEVDPFDFGGQPQLQALTRLKDIVNRNPDLLPEVLVYLLPIALEKTLEEFAPDLLELYNPIQSILGLARKIDDPYYRARALIRLSSIVYRQWDKVLEEAISAANLIKDPHQCVQVIELLLQILTQDKGETLYGIAFEAAKRISDPENRARAFARLSTQLPDRWHERAIDSAIEALSLIEDEYARAEVSQVLMEHLGLSPESKQSLLKIVDKLTRPFMSAKALNRVGIGLMGAFSENITSYICDSPELWMPILLSSAALDVEEYFNRRRPISGLWRSISIADDIQVVSELLSLGLDEGLELTRDAVEALDSLIARGDNFTLEALLPLMHSPTPQAIPRIERWRTSSNAFVSSHATLFLSERMRIINQETIQPLTMLLASKYDRSNYRAQLILAGRNWTVSLKKQVLRLTALGFEAMTALGQAISDFEFEDVQIARNIYMAIASVTFDSPEMLFAWADCLRDFGPGYEAARVCLQYMFVTSDSAWDAAVKILCQYPTHVQRALIQSMSVMAVTPGNLTPERYVQLANALKESNPDELSSIHMLPNPHAAVASAAIELGTQSKLEPGIAIKLANEQLEQASLSAAELATMGVSKMQATLAAIGDSLLLPRDKNSSEAVFASHLIERNPTSFAFLIRWLIAVLQESVRDDVFFLKLHALLTVAACTASRMPDAFANLADPRVLEPLLIDAFKQHNTVLGRQASLTLLSYMRRVSSKTAAMFLASFRSDRIVQDEALTAVERFRRFDGDVLSPIVSGLNDVSTMTSYGAARLLSTLCRGERVRSSERRMIVEAIASALNHPTHPYQGIYSIIGGYADDDPARVVNLMRLDRGLYQVLLEVSGLM